MKNNQKQFEMNVDHCKGAALEPGSLFILKSAFKERILNQPHHQPPDSRLLPRSNHADKKAYELEEKLLKIDARIKHGLELIVAKLK